MKDKNKIFEVDKEYKEEITELYVIVPGKKELKVHGRIEKVTNGDHVQYWGWLSHYFKFSSDSPAYIGEDDSIFGSAETVTERVKQHLESFTSQYGVLENKHYK